MESGHEVDSSWPAPLLNYCSCSTFRKLWVEAEEYVVTVHHQNPPWVAVVVAAWAEEVCAENDTAENEVDSCESEKCVPCDWPQSWRSSEAMIC